MIRPRRAVAAVAAATLTVLAFSGAPANAERQRHHDQTRDVIELFAGESPVTGDLRLAPGNRTTDVTRVVMRHTPNRVIVRTHFRDLNARTGFEIYQIQTDRGFAQGMQLLGDNVGGPLVARAAGLPRAAAQSSHRFELYTDQGPVECEGLTYWAHRKADRARMSIPRECLGNPRWVRMGAAAISFDMDAERVLADDALAGPLTLEEFGMSRTLRRG